MPALPVIAAIYGGAQLGYQVYAGEQQAKAQRKNYDLQKKTQQQAEAAAVETDRRAQEDLKRARKKQPDLNVLLGDLMKPKPGPADVNADQLLLGRPSLLGG